MPIVAVGSVERGEVELVHHVEDEPDQVALGQPVTQVGWQQEGLVAVATQEAIGHSLLYYFITFAPNARNVRRRLSDLPGHPGRRCGALLAVAANADFEAAVGSCRQVGLLEVPGRQA